MMQSVSLTLTLSLVLVCSLRLTEAGNGFTVGHLRADDEEIASVEEMGKGAPDYIFNYFKTYTGNNHHVIGQVVCEDQTNGEGALAAIVAGGPGHTFVTIAYTLPRNVEMKFKVRIYGQFSIDHLFV